MANPRLTVSFEDIDIHVTSFKSTGLTANDAPTGIGDLGTAVTVASSDTVGAGSAGNRLFGQIAQYEDDGIVSVIDRGYVTLPYTGTAPAVATSVELDGNGGVRAATSDNVASGNIVVSVDTTAKTCVVRL